MRPPRDSAVSDGYSRPQQAWHCGLADDGPPCPLGPDGRGCCPGAAACHPLRAGDRWVCNRSPERGGPCEDGPGHDGRCGVAQHCTPVRALRSRRGRFVVGCLVAAVGAIVMAMSGRWRNELIVPGELSPHHAHLVTGANAEMRCAQCHAAGNATAAQWLGVGESSTSGATQTSLCMACHEKSFPNEMATAAHNVSLASLRTAAGVTESAPPHGDRDAAEPIACAACHREHQGREHDLAAITDAACQACHRVRFASFGSGHPEFGLWPYEQRTRIAFDHASHLQKHFPAGQREFSCATCHEPDAAGDRQLTRSYAATCAECHDKALGVSLAQGVSLAALPMLDVAALADAGQAVGAWPAEADGDFDGRVGVFAVALVLAKPLAADATRVLGADFDYFDLDVDDAAQTAAGVALARELKSLVDDVATRGEAAVRERIATLLGREVSDAELRDLAGTLQTAPTGGGVVRLKPAGHDDPTLRAWLDALAEASAGPQGKLVEPLLRAALKPTAPGQCGSCHTVERSAAGRLAVQWRAAPAREESFGLTTFAHDAHLLQSQLRDCAACHRVAATASAAVAPASDDPRQFVAQFEPMTKTTCANCHAAGAAGDSCTQCHRYHSKAGDLRLEARGPMQRDLTTLQPPVYSLQPQH